jgi:hypothetical protein
LRKNVPTDTKEEEEEHKGCTVEEIVEEPIEETVKETA